MQNKREKWSKLDESIHNGTINLAIEFYSSNGGGKLKIEMTPLILICKEKKGGKWVGSY